MRLAVLLGLGLLAVLVAGVESRNHRRKHKEVEPEKPKDELDMLAEDEVHEEKEKAVHEETAVNEIVETQPEPSKVVPVEDPCLKKHCGPGQECKLNEEREAVCDCVQKCEPERDARRKVCSNHNETWDSDCSVYRMRCLCTKQAPECSESRYKHVHIDYYGVCREIEDCSDDEMADFPRRMREWLLNVLQDLAKKQDLGDILVELEKEAQGNQARKWVNAVIWKFCDLDSHPHDRTVSRHELFPLRAPLMAMEHCIAPFLNSCDPNDDHIISLVEWGKCLGLEETEIEDKCAFLRGTMSKS